MAAANGREAEGSAVKVGLSWLVVALPAAWGVYNTVLRAAHLFGH